MSLGFTQPDKETIALQNKAEQNVFLCSKKSTLTA